MVNVDGAEKLYRMLTKEQKKMAQGVAPLPQSVMDTNSHLENYWYFNVGEYDELSGLTEKIKSHVAIIEQYDGILFDSKG